MQSEKLARGAIIQELESKLRQSNTELENTKVLLAQTQENEQSLMKKLAQIEVNAK